MQIHIQAQDGVPIYLQVMQQIKYLVASGRLGPGEELPSIRALAEHLRVTVAKLRYLPFLGRCDLMSNIRSHLFLPKVWGIGLAA